MHGRSSAARGFDHRRPAGRGNRPRSREAGLIVVGTYHRVRSGRFGLGSLADALLHASAVPVALAPAGYQAHPAISRITCAVGMQPGAENLLDAAIHLADEWKVPLRLMSLVAVGEGGSEDRRRDWTQRAEQHAATLVAKATAALPAECAVTSVVGHGESLEDAVQGLEFEDSEIVLIGSSRLAQPKRLFRPHGQQNHACAAGSDDRLAARLRRRSQDSLTREYQMRSATATMSSEIAEMRR